MKGLKIGTLLCVIISLLFLALEGHAQNSKAAIQGTIKDSDGQTLEGVHISLKNTNKGTTSNAGGYFRLENIKEGDYILEVSHLSFEPRFINVSVKGGNTIQLQTIELNQKSENLNEVVVQGEHQSHQLEKLSPSLRLSGDVIKVPQNVQVISDELIKSQQSISMMENITRNVSGAQMIEHWGSFARINMRGFKLPAFRNGMNVEMPWGPLTEDLSMIERVEFVKGPAGFMMSAGEPGGFYNVVTKKPVSYDLLDASFTTGSFGLYRGTVDAGGSLTANNKLQYRLNVMGQTNGSHRKFEESNRITVVPALTYQFSDRTSLTAEFTHQKASVPLGRAYVFAPSASGFGSLDRDFAMMDENFPNSDIKETSLYAYATHQISQSWTVNAQYSTTKYDQVGASPWPRSVESNGDAIRGISSWDALNLTDLAQLYTTGSISGAGITHNILAGVDYSNKRYWADWSQGGAADTTVPFNVFNPVYGNGQLPVFDRSENVKTRGEGNKQGNEIVAYYLQDEIGVIDNRLRLTLAARYTDATVFAYGNTTDNTKITPRLGLSFDITDDFTAYALYDQSFFPQFGASATGESFDPEEGKDIEGGVKKNWVNGKLRTSLTAYQITKQNILVADPENVNFSIQLGEIQSKGVEFDMNGQVTPELNVVLNYANTNVEITEDTTPENVGKRVAGHAKHITNGWLNYSFKKQSKLDGFGLSLGYQYQVDRSSWAWNADNQSALPDYFRLDGGVSWKNERMDVKVNVNNILNKHLYSGSSYGSFLYWQSEPGTNFRLTVAYKFI